MKKLNLVFLSLFFFQSTFAFRLELPGGVEIKGEDPQIVKDSVEAVQKGTKEVANGTRDVISAVGNATGISGVLDHNVETIEHVGRVASCLSTLCVSEYLRQKEIERVETESKRNMEAALAEYQRSLEANEFTESALQISKLHGQLTKHKDILSEKLKLIEKQVILYTGLQEVLKREAEYRNKLKSLGVSSIDNSADLASGVSKFEKDLKADMDVAAANLEMEVQKVAQETGKSVSRLFSQVFRLISDQSLGDLQYKVADRLNQLQETKVSTQMDFLENQAKLDEVQSKSSTEGKK